MFSVNEVIIVSKENFAKIVFAHYSISNFNV